MPTYEYRCLTCSHEFEAFQSISAEPLKICPECGQEVKRLISAGSGFLFKGSGFYVTDYRSNNYKERAQKESDGPSSSEKTEKTSTGTSTPPPTSTTAKPEAPQAPTPA